MEFEYDAKNLLYVRIDPQSASFWGTVFLRALGLKTDDEILRGFYRVDRIQVEGNELFRVVSDSLIGTRFDSGGDQQKGRYRCPQGPQADAAFVLGNTEGEDREIGGDDGRFSRALSLPPTWSRPKAAKCWPRRTRR